MDQPVGSVEFISFKGAHVTLTAQCKYKDARWTEGNEIQKSYVLIFERDAKLAGTFVSLLIMPDQGECLQKNEADWTQGWRCTSNGDRVQVIVECSLQAQLDAGKCMLRKLYSHTSEDLAASSAGYDPELECLSEALEAGLDGAVECEPCGFALTLQVPASIRNALMITKRIQDGIDEVLERGVEGCKLKAATEYTLWNYLPRHIGPAIPPVDRSLPATQAKCEAGFRLSKFLGRGALGAVFRLHARRR